MGTVQNTTSFNGDFYDADYYENGRKSGKGWLENYHWMPERSIKEAKGFIDFLSINDNESVLDVGCAKGFIVKAMRLLNINADGCDISEYALSFAPEGCWNCSDDNSWENKYYDHVIIKDVLEHCTFDQLVKLLSNISKVTSSLSCVIPLGENNKYIIPEYHIEISHLIAKNEDWWAKTFYRNGWRMVRGTYHVEGIKDNWYKVNPKGNYAFRLVKT